MVNNFGFKNVEKFLEAVLQQEVTNRSFYVPDAFQENLCGLPYITQTQARRFLPRFKGCYGQILLFKNADGTVTREE